MKQFELYDADYGQFLRSYADLDEALRSIAEAISGGETDLHAVNRLELLEVTGDESVLVGEGQGLLGLIEEKLGVQIPTDNATWDGFPVSGSMTRVS